MNRRTFLKLSSLALLPWSCTTPELINYDFPIKVLSDHHIGHLLWKSHFFPTQKKVKKHDVLIVGGGVSGISATYQLQDKDFVLCEASQQLGGTSSTYEFEGVHFAQGAHYDLAYPNFYGKELLDFLHKLKLTTYNTERKLWEFTDKQYLIYPENESRCFQHGKFTDDVLSENQLTEEFYNILAKYEDQMIVPTSMTKKNLHHLNKVSFLDFLKQKKLKIDNRFVSQVDYHMMDDYGGTTAQVSALAGIHYYQCRPYFKKPVELFSPPQGNHYFLEKIYQNIANKERILCNRLVKKITPKRNKFEVEVINAAQQTNELYEVNKVIYAGTKHALKYVFPKDENLFTENEYAPWVIINIIIEHQNDLPVFWQNEMLTEEKAFMGFVNSHSQHASIKDKYQVLTAYYCFQTNERKKVLNTLEAPKNFVNSTIKYISTYFGKDISPYIKKVFLKGIGHAMAIPKPHFLLNDKNEQRSHENLVYAGVDNGRIPIFPEAVDTGIQASNLLYNK